MTIDILDKVPGPSPWRRLFGSVRFRLLLIALVATILLTIQSVVARQPTLRSDFATLVVVYLALEQSFGTGLVMTLVVGYVADVFSGEPRGLYMASLVIVFLLLRMVVFRIVGSRWFIVTAIAVLSTLAALLVRLAIESMLGPGEASLADVSPALVATFGVAATFGYPIYRLLRFIEERFRGREEAM